MYHRYPEQIIFTKLLKISEYFRGVVFFYFFSIYGAANLGIWFRAGEGQ